jgi:hypothetical protein
MSTLSNSTSVRLPNDASLAAFEEAKSDAELEELDVEHFKDLVTSL